MKRFALSLLCLCLCLAIGLTVTDAWAKKPHKLQAVAVVAHSGYITGTVATCDPDEVVPDALVYLPGISIMAKTNKEGKFLLLYVPKGVYTLAIELPGRPPFFVKDVVVKKMEFTELGTVAVCPACAENSDCPADAFCARAPGECDGDGVCRPRPDACAEIWDPVCGCDGVTYGNSCVAAAAGANVAHPGECEAACAENSDCPADAFCARAPGECDGDGVCQPRPGACPMIWAPVCGCDGATYGNSCEAAAAGVNVAHPGECEVACAENADCPAASLCVTPPGDCDGGGVCQPIPDVCPEIWDPVCGCDGTTYSNTCAAAAAGVGVAAKGECPEPN